MDNGGFEMQGEGLPNSKMQNNHKNVYDTHCEEKRRSCSLMKIFLVCFLACLITTAIGVLILSLVYVGHFDQKTSVDTSSPSVSTNSPIAQTEARYRFMNRLGRSKQYVFEGGAVQWARYRSNPAQYSSDSEMTFGNSINKHKSKLTASIVRIKYNGLRAPQWHFNANEHGLLLEGKAWIGVVDDGANSVATYNVTVGQVTFFPTNTLHWVKCVSEEDCVFILFFTTHDELKTLDVDDAFFETPEDIASRSLKPEGGVDFIRQFQKSDVDQAINLPKNLVDLIQNASLAQSDDSLVWKYFHDLIGSKEYLFPGGIIQWARHRSNTAGLTENEKIYSDSINTHADTLTFATLRIYNNGLRQPHFHFNANEMGYVISGCGVIGIVGAEPVEEFSVDVGDIFFFPLGTQHYVKSTCVEDLYTILAFSTGDQLETLDMDDYFHATADDVLAQLFRVKQEEFKKIPKFQADQAVNIP